MITKSTRLKTWRNFILNHIWRSLQVRKCNYVFAVHIDQTTSKHALFKRILFAGFNNTCDLSAVLGILANSSIFHAHVQTNAKDVRSKVRNEWGHCNFDHWTDIEFINCFQIMETMVRSLGLPKPDEDKQLDDLRDWETKG